MPIMGYTYFNAAVLHGQVQRRIAFFVARLYIILLVGRTVSLS